MQEQCEQRCVSLTSAKMRVPGSASRQKLCILTFGHGARAALQILSADAMRGPLGRIDGVQSLPDLKDRSEPPLPILEPVPTFSVGPKPQTQVLSTPVGSRVGTANGRRPVSSKKNLPSLGWRAHFADKDLPKEVLTGDRWWISSEIQRTGVPGKKLPSLPSQSFAGDASLPKGNFSRASSPRTNHERTPGAWHVPSKGASEIGTASRGLERQKSERSFSRTHSMTTQSVASFDETDDEKTHYEFGKSEMHCRRTITMTERKRNHNAALARDKVYVQKLLKEGREKNEDRLAREQALDGHWLQAAFSPVPDPSKYLAPALSGMLPLTRQQVKQATDATAIARRSSAVSHEVVHEIVLEHSDIQEAYRVCNLFCALTTPEGIIGNVDAPVMSRQTFCHLACAAQGFASVDGSHPRLCRAARHFDSLAEEVLVKGSATTTSGIVLLDCRSPGVENTPMARLFSKIVQDIVPDFDRGLDFDVVAQRGRAEFQARDRVFFRLLPQAGKYAASRLAHINQQASHIKQWLEKREAKPKDFKEQELKELKEAKERAKELHLQDRSRLLPVFFIFCCTLYRRAMQTSLKTLWPSAFVGKPQCQCHCAMQQMEARLDAKLGLLQEQLSQLTAMVQKVVVKDEIPATVPDDDADQEDFVDSPNVPEPPQCGQMLGAVKEEKFDWNLAKEQVVNIDISDEEDDESLDPEQREIAERVLEEVSIGKEWDTQASQDRLLLPENRVEMGGRFARRQMAHLSGATTATALGSSPTSSTKLLELIHQELQQIPEEQLRTSSRKNVRPDGEKVTMQMALGLVTSGHWRHIPMAGKKTYQHLRLQQLIFAYVQVRAREQGISLTGFTFSSIQITKNLQTKRHKDKKNNGLSLIFTLGDHTGGELYIEDEQGSEQVHVVRNQLVKFDGSRHWHGTKEFRGTRYAVVLYSMGTASYEETPALTRAFLTELGYQLPAVAFKEVITPELEELARKAARGEKVPDEAGRHEPPKGKRKADATITPDAKSGPSKRPAKSSEEPAAAAASEAGPEDEAPWSDKEVAILCNMKAPAQRSSYSAIGKRLNRSSASVKLKWQSARSPKYSRSRAHTPSTPNKEPPVSTPRTDVEEPKEDGKGFWIQELQVKSENLLSSLFEPEVLRFMAQTSQLFRVIFKAYADIPLATGQGHMSLSALVRFAADFGLFPHKVDFKTIQWLYNTESQVVPQAAAEPRTNSVIHMAPRKTRKKTMVNSEEGLLYHHKWLKPHLAWMSKEPASMTEAETRSCLILTAIDDWLESHNLKVKEVFANTDTANTSTFTLQDLQLVVDFMDFEDPPTSGDLQALIGLLVLRQGSTAIDFPTLEMARVAARLAKESRSRARNCFLKDLAKMSKRESSAYLFFTELAANLEFHGLAPESFYRMLDVDHTGLVSVEVVVRQARSLQQAEPRLSSSRTAAMTVDNPFAFIGKTVDDDVTQEEFVDLLEEIREASRLREASFEQKHPLFISSGTVQPANSKESPFGVEAFVKVVMKIGLMYLTYYGNEPQAQLSSFHKLLWLFIYMHWYFDSSRQKAEELLKQSGFERPRSKRRPSSRGSSGDLGRRYPKHLPAMRQLLVRHPTIFMEVEQVELPGWAPPQRTADAILAAACRDVPKQGGSPEDGWRVEGMDEDDAGASLGPIEEDPQQVIQGPTTLEQTLLVTACNAHDLAESMSEADLGQS
eukprot:s1054_g13.t1